MGGVVQTTGEYAFELALCDCICVSFLYDGGREIWFEETGVCDCEEEEETRTGEGGKVVVAEFAFAEGLLLELEGVEEDGGGRAESEEMEEDICGWLA